MGQEPVFELPEGLLELMHAQRAEWPARRAALHATGVPLAEGDPDPDPDPKPDPHADPDPDPDPDPEEGKTFDAAYVKKLREEAAKHRRESREANARVKEFEDKDKSETQKLQDAASEAEKRATAAEATSLRFEVALDKAPEGMSVAHVRKLAKRLAGGSREELEADAEELFADFAPSNGGGQEPSHQRTPRERLRPGAAPSSEPEETDPAKLAAKVPRRY